VIATWGGVSFPLDPAQFTANFTAADPIRALLLGLFSAAITAELGEAWSRVSSTLEFGHQLRGKPAIADTLELAPTHIIMQQRKAAFPLLALHRVDRRTYEYVGWAQRKRTQEWNLHYILGPLEVGAARKLLDSCLLVEGVVDSVLMQGRHDAYRSGEPVFGPGSPLDRVYLTGAEGPGQALYGGERDSGTIYWATVLSITTTETGADTGVTGEAGDPPLDGASFQVGVGSEEGRLPAVVLADTDTILE
jgi:hypothetical protein